MKNKLYLLSLVATLSILSACATNQNQTTSEETSQYSQTTTTTSHGALESISISGNYKTEFIINETFTYDGLIVTAHYSDNTSEEVEDYLVSSPNMSSLGQKTITVSYQEKGITQTASYNITVGQKPDTGTVVVNEEDPNAKSSTIKAFLNENGKSDNKTTLYRIKGIAQWPKNTTYGNFDLVDDTGYVFVYGCAKNKSTMTKTNSTYEFNNDKSYGTMNIKAGDEVTMEGLYLWYTYPGKSYGYAEFVGYVTSIKRNNASTIQGKNYTASEPTDTSGSYYSSITSSDSGSDMLTKLHDLMDTTHKNYTSYGSLDNYFGSSDKYGTSGVKCFYSGERANSYNKEHVWPQSLSNGLYGENYAGADLHHIRPTISTYNSIRSNAMFAPVYGTKSVMKSVNYETGGASYCTGNVFEPADSIKGDVARIIMYVYMHYASTIGGASRTYYGDLKINWVMGTNPTDSWKLLRKWNAEDPVSQDEITRNNYAFSIQKNRNPFIDHPTYADRIWG